MSSIDNLFPDIVLNNNKVTLTSTLEDRNCLIAVGDLRIDYTTQLLLDFSALVSQPFLIFFKIKEIKQDIVSYSGYELVFLILEQVLFEIQLNLVSLIKKIQKTFYVIGLVALVSVLIAYDLTQEVSEA